MTGPSQPAGDPAGSDGQGPNRKAIWSVVCGVVAFATLYVFPFGALILSFPAITSGIHARREIIDSKGEQHGDSIAVIGIMNGVGALVTFLVSSALDQLGRG
ncbi:MAG: hypothetical protein JWR27_553 [Aeromicrobium sp.]|nr:hypothetical protein [Aeromicrobium sp.]